MEQLRRDSIWLGLIIGILSLHYYSVFCLPFQKFAPEGTEYLIKLPTLILISVFPNLFTLRYYLKNLKYDRTGRGILLVTFVYAILYFVVYLKFV
jgi:hypothetical protein